MDILISGSGIAGPVAAYWLLKGNPQHHITLVERDAALRTTGQSIDIRQSAVDIIRKMGLEQAIRDKSTHEAGIQFIDERGRPFATFPASGDSEQQGFTSEFEILRGDLVEIFFNKVKDDIKVIFGDYVNSWKEVESGKVEVKFVNGTATQSFDLIIASDGQSSKIRNIALKTLDDRRRHFRPFNNYASYFTMKSIESLGDSKFATWYNATGGRVLFVRPDTRPGYCRANIIKQFASEKDEGNERYRKALSDGNEVYKSLLREEFKDAGWEVEAILKGMDSTDDFYASETAQVKPPVTVIGRVALVGDAGYCPTPLTGMGTSLAIIGAYILAGEINQTDNVLEALNRYNEIILPFARSVQNIPSSMPAYVNPQSSLALSVVRNTLWFVSWSGITNLIAKVAGVTSLNKKYFTPPKYSWDKDE